MRRALVYALTCALLAGGVALAQPRPPARIGQAAPPTPTVLPGTKASAFGTLQGNAASSIDEALGGWAVRLRDARFGEVVNTEKTDASGHFVFSQLDPGNYVVELLDQDQKTVVAVSPLLAVNAGDAITTAVRLPFALAQAGHWFSNAGARAAIISLAAAGAGIAAVAVVGAQTCPTVR